ncbi:MAG TPA: ATP-binding protein [Verrucomicrobiae bacterium]|jgi:anti-sigma regulatory factor (Ser/Thr protein kinase)
MPANTIVIRNSFAELARLNREVGELLAAVNASPAIVNLAELVLEEIVTNVIKYGFTDGAEHPIEIGVEADASGMTLSVIDTGREFNPLSLPDPDINAPIEEREIGGLGVMMVRTMMDSVEYRREGDKNIFLMRKKFGDETATP